MGLVALIGDPTLAERIGIVGRKTAFLFGVLVSYLILGAFVFQLTEYNARDEEVQETVAELDLERSQLLEVLWAETIAKTEDDWAQIANDKMDMYEKSVRAAAAKGIDLDETVSDDNPWSFLGSLYYAYTVVTTVGYGNVYPSTAVGKLATIVYGIFGIPLTLLYLTEVGKLLTLVLKAILRKKWTHFDRTDEFNFSPWVAFAITTVFLLFGAILFDVLENDDEDMPAIDAIWFIFISTTTIGLGDITPAVDWLLIVHLLYSFAALSLCSMCFFTMQSYLDRKLNGVEKHLHAYASPWNGSAQSKKNDDGVPDIVVEEDEEEEED